LKHTPNYRILTPFSRLAAFFGSEFRKGPWQRHRFAVAVALTCWALGSADVEGRSTFSARFDPESVAGPDITQKLLLVLSFFPGDGEAIVRAHVDFDNESLRVVTAHSARGILTQSATRMEIDYSQQPLSKAVSDSLTIELMPLKDSTDVPFMGTVYSSTSVDEAAHQAVVDLRVRPPLDLTMSVAPRHVFAGEQIDIRLQFNNPNTESVVSGVHLKWPDGVLPQPGEDNLSTLGISPGGSAEATIRCQIQGEDPRVEGEDPRIEGGDPRIEWLQGHVISAEAHGSPLPPSEFHVAGLPVLRAAAKSGSLQQGRAQPMTLGWHNPAANGPLLADAFRALIPASFGNVSVIDAGGGSGAGQAVSISGDREIVVGGPLVLQPGGQFTVDLQVTPGQPGPFEWTGSFIPGGTERVVGMRAGGGVVRVNSRQAESFEEVELGGWSVTTDLEAVIEAMRERLTEEVLSAPLSRGDRLHLSPTDKNSRSWLVDELMTEALMHRGIIVVVQPNVAPSDAPNDVPNDVDDENDSENGISTMYYRLVDARVVYRPSGSALKSIFGAKKRSREASGDLLLRLENPAGRIDWVSRVRASWHDVVEDRHVSWLGSEDVVRAEINPGNKAVELGLSGSIAIGLLAIFFAP
jgi:hypothetical protein